MSINKAIVDLVRKGSKKWTKQRKAEERQKSAIQNRRQRMLTTTRVTIKDAAYACMEQAYREVSANGSLPANARQIMYRARPIIQARTGEQLDDTYFTQTLLPNYLNEYAVNWDVVYDDRGHFHEPHTEHSIGLGTLAVRNYFSSMHGPELSELAISLPTMATRGPDGRFGAVLFIEKEGFMPLFESVHLAERFDIAIMSTKGQSNTASRLLIDKLCGERKVPLLVVHDFDKAGFSILGKLQHDNRRYEYMHDAKVVDLGLRLADVQALDLEQYAEDMFDRGSEIQRRNNMLENGAKRDEVEFLINRRVELNAMASDVLIQWIENKLAENGVAKIVPSKEGLDDLYRRNLEARFLDSSLTEAKQEAKSKAAQVAIPNNLRDRIEARLKEEPELSWDSAVADIVNAEFVRSS
jgi:DNA topoisomerase VI subunit A